VSPTVHVDADPSSPVGVNQTVKFTCDVKGFYPGNVAVTWLENGMEMSVENTFRLVEMSQGLFQLSSVVEVKAMEEKNGSTFTCRVAHDAQVPVESVTTLWIAAPDREGVNKWALTVNSLNLLSSPGLWFGILLEKGLLGGLLVFLFKR
ncbi:SHPS1 phosphatase, partial [Arenaria interpres]|nr:SHPS1 phosphatase [Arenaria interpres]